MYTSHNPPDDRAALRDLLTRLDRMLTLAEPVSHDDDDLYRQAAATRLNLAHGILHGLVDGPLHWADIQAEGHVLGCQAAALPPPAYKAAS